MKTMLNSLRLSFLKKTGILLLLAFTGVACVEDIGESYVTFTGDMIYSYLEQRPDTFGEYIKVIDKAGLKGMLSAYGSYTCLAPTNEAFEAYYRSLGPNIKFEDLTQEQIDYLAKTHIVAPKYLTETLQDGVIPNTNMNQRYIEVKFDIDSIRNTMVILFNNDARLLYKDIEVYNGVIHGINRVLKPSTAQLPELIASNPDLSIFSEALKLTGMADSLRLVEDKSYVPVKTYKDEYDGYVINSPEFRKFGYTALVETNAVFQANGINNVQDLIERAKVWYPGSSAYDNDFTHRNNSLNKFISYHLVEKAIYQFFYKKNMVPNAELYEFVESMYPYRIMKITQAGPTGITINPGTDREVVVSNQDNKTTTNGIYHLLQNILVYSPNVEETLMNTRIRFDLAALFPELANNSIRGYSNSTNDRWGFPEGYFKYLKASKDTRLLYLSGAKETSWINYQGDELMGLGSYDINMRLIPVPPGTYELRFAVSANQWRSVTQIYVDNKPVGIPFDLRIMADDPRIGWVNDNNTDDSGFENDKTMRNRGYMKGPTSFKMEYGNTIARNTNRSFRRIIGTFTFTEYQEVWVRFKSVLENPKSQMMMDYFELVPKSVYNRTDGEPETRD